MYLHIFNYQGVKERSENVGRIHVRNFGGKIKRAFVRAQFKIVKFISGFTVYFLQNHILWQPILLKASRLRRRLSNDLRYLNENPILVSWVMRMSIFKWNDELIQHY